MSVADELIKLVQLRKDGTITEEDFAKMKAKIIAGQPSAATSPASQRRRKKWPWWRYPLTASGIIAGGILLVNSLPFIMHVIRFFAKVVEDLV